MMHMEINTFSYRNTEAIGSSNSVLDEINKRGRDQDAQITHVLNAITKLEKCVRAMEVRIVRRI